MSASANSKKKDAEAQKSTAAQAAVPEKTEAAPDLKDAEAQKSAQKPIDFGAERYTLVNKAKSGQKVLGSRGQAIEFDADGKASVDAFEAKRFSAIPGYEVRGK
jgi:hypothetical protein